MITVLSFVWSLLVAFNIDEILELVYQIFPLIITLTMLGVVIGIFAGLTKGRGKRGRLGAFVPLFLVFSFVSFLCFASPVAAAASASPGSTSTWMSMPVSESFSGLTASTLYHVFDVNDGNSSTDVTADSDGEASVMISPTEYGQNLYYLVLGSAHGPAVVSFTIDNNDIMIYMVPILGLIIIMSIITAVITLVQKPFGR